MVVNRRGCGSIDVEGDGYKRTGQLGRGLKNNTRCLTRRPSCGDL